jgi:hypothetical protein
METPSEGDDSVNKLPSARLPQSGPQVLGTNLKRSESGGEPACRTRLSPRRQLLANAVIAARRLVVSARAYVGFVRANVAEYDLAEVIPRAAGP